MKKLGRVTKSTKVRDAEKLLTVPAILVREDEGLYEIAGKVAASPVCKTLAVVDGTGKLMGVIPVSLVIDDVFLQVMPEEFLSDIMDVDNVVDFARKTVVSKARDLMQAPVWVGMENTVRDAFERMHKNGLSGLPIVDEKGQTIGYLDMLELLLVWLKSKGE